ncbi:MAG: AAA family ATPase [Paraprevotella sp.]|nr:AAA family ATPase [Paraprevotella sp.]
MIYINKVRIEKALNERKEYPYNVPAVRNLNELEFKNNVTFIIGENGVGKSTLVEAIAISAGFNPEGGSLYMNYKTYNTHSALYQDFKLIRSAYRNKDGYFLRAESFYNIASEIDRISDNRQLLRNYGGALHNRSHGESFLGVFLNRLSGDGLYIFDEPESALSFSSLLKLLVKINELEKKNSQFIIATHSPVLLAYPNADIYTITNTGLEHTKYHDTAPYLLTKYFILNHEKMINDLLRKEL